MKSLVTLFLSFITLLVSWFFLYMGQVLELGNEADQFTTTFLGVVLSLTALAISNMTAPDKVDHVELDVPECGVATPEAITRVEAATRAKYIPAVEGKTVIVIRLRGSLSAWVHTHIDSMDIDKSKVGFVRLHNTVSDAVAREFPHFEGDVWDAYVDGKWLTGSEA